jgi:hypothetical protein
MRKLIAVGVAAVLLTSLSGAAIAAKKKPVKVHETFGESLAPFPKDERWNDAGFSNPGCYSGQEGINWVAQEFTAPGKGTLRMWMEGFTGDHDMYLYIDDAIFLRGDQAQVGGTAMAPPEEEILYTMKKGQTITMIACNWAGQPDVLAHYEGTFK